jgi:hypothetical protein
VWCWSDALLAGLLFLTNLDASLAMVRATAIGGSLTFTAMTIAAGMFAIGYYYRGWPEKITSGLARGLLLASPSPALVAMNWCLALPTPAMDGWVRIGLALALLAASLAICGYAYWRFYLPFLRQHPAYRERRR